MHSATPQRPCRSTYGMITVPHLFLQQKWFIQYITYGVLWICSDIPFYCCHQLLAIKLLVNLREEAAIQTSCLQRKPIKTNRIQFLCYSFFWMNWPTAPGPIIKYILIIKVSFVNCEWRRAPSVFTPAVCLVWSESVNEFVAFPFSLFSFTKKCITTNHVQSDYQVCLRQEKQK